MTFEEWKEWLKEKEACQPAMDFVTTQTSILAAIENCPDKRWLNWLTSKLPIWKEYQEKTDAFWKEYEDKRKPLVRKYEERRRSFLGLIDEYEEEAGHAWNEFVEKRDPFLNEYHAKTTPIMKELLTAYYKAE